MASQQNIIKNFVSSLDNTTLSGTAALDEAVSSVSNYSSWQNLIDTMVSDAAVYEGHSTDFLKDMCDIVLDNEDTGAITGSDAGGTTKTAESIVIENGSWTYPSETSTTYASGLTVNWPDSSSLSDTEKWIVGALYTWWIPSALTLVNSSYGINFNEDGTTVKSLTLGFINNPFSSALASTSSSKTGQKTEDLTIKINMSHYSDLDTSDKNGSASGSNVYLDRTIAHELTHAVMAANIDYFFQLPTLFTEGVAELTHGIDDRRRDDIDSLGGSSNRLKNALSGSSSNSNIYSAGYMLLRYLAKQASYNRDPSQTPTYVANDTDDSDSSSESTTTSNFSINGDTITVNADFTDQIWLNGVNLFTGESSSYENESIITVDATAMKYYGTIAGNMQSNVISAGSGGSQLWGGFGGNDTLNGGSGADTFWYGIWENSDDVINNFGEEDLLMAYDLSLEKITNFEYNDKQISVGFNNEHNITINTTGDTSTYQIGDGSRWKYTRSSDSWSIT